MTEIGISIEIDNEDLSSKYIYHCASVKKESDILKTLTKDEIIASKKLRENL